MWKKIILALGLLGLGTAALLLPPGSSESKKIRETFTHIYDSGYWKHGQDIGGAGTGSTASVTEAYRKFLQQFLADYNIQTVVDAGCGDWEFSKLIDWDGVQYTGIDVVPSVVKSNRKIYQKRNIHFIEGDAIHMNLPVADLLICKDVLQHLTNEDIFQFIRQFPKFKHCLITNDLENFSTPPVININLKERGGCRQLDLTQPPFNLIGVKILTYPAEEGVVKQVLHLSHQ
jgi:SAM-dependent methyltransferase